MASNCPGERLVVPGWFATYWVKMLNDIEVLDTNYWTKVAYTIPDTPHANIKPGENRREDDSDQSKWSPDPSSQSCVRP
jgi:DMSO/TMAO reductase YedYZ molybdopterin-dependent catalytic subunit